jgi:sigma-B regulation protein RsbU (phosphoserine phosphatase)
MNDAPAAATCRLTRAIDEATLREIQDGLALATRSTVGIVDAEGRLILPPKAGNSLGELLLRAEHTADDQRARIEAAARALTDTREGWIEDAALALGHLVIPITAGAAPLGTLVLGDRPVRRWNDEHARGLADRWRLDGDALAAAALQCEPWSEQDRQAAVDLGMVTASILARLCLQEQQLHHRIKELSVIYDMAGMLTGTRSVQELLDRVARKVCDVMQTRACSIRLLDEHTGELVIKAVYNLSDRYLQKGPVLVEHHPIDVEAIKGNIIYIEDVPNDPRVKYPEDARAEGLVSCLVCGMVYRGKPVGVVRVYTGTKHRFSHFEESLLRAIADQAAVAIVNARLYQAALEAERNERQLRYAGEVQRRMIPAAPPNWPGASFGCIYKPCREVGGDFYDFIELPGKNLGIAIADVIGKGVPAALIMASLRSALRVYTYHIYDVERIMSQVNDHMCRETHSNEFATVFYGVLMPGARRFTYCNAGHEPPLLVRNGQVQSLETGGMAIGVAKGQTFDKGILELQPNDVLLMHTDGVVESMNFAEEEYGRQRLCESCRKYAHLDPAQIVKNILWDVRRFIGLSDLADDMTMVAIKVK